MARNLKTLRERVPVRELSQRLTRLGRPILPSGITKIEQGHRRVDVDDLVALAIALDVSPNRLVLDPGADDGELPLTDAVVVTRGQAWDWATGAHPLPEADHAQPDPFPSVTRIITSDVFARNNRPNEPKPVGTQLKDLLDLGETIDPVWEAAKAAMRTAGVTFDQVIEYLHVAHTMDTTLRAMIETHPDNPSNKPKRTRARKDTTKGDK
jgi:transcriptional regulator with XRE-family HTH domain